MMKKLFIYYNFIIVTLLSVFGFMSAESMTQVMIAVLFYPVAVYFALIILPRRNRALKLPLMKAHHKSIKLKKVKNKKQEEVQEDLEPVTLTKLSEQEGFDLDRRAFVKLIGSAGISVFLLSLFTKKAQAAFFGSVPGPGVVALKDSQGTTIDPAKHHPTDGYRIYKLDDSATTAYYGFKDKDGNWFILEDNSGTYMYAVGSSTDDFDTAWGIKNTTLTYYLYEDVFN